MKEMLMFSVLCVWMLQWHGVASQDPCPKECQCTVLPSGRVSAFCTGDSLVNITSQLPRHTAEYHYKAVERTVNLGDTNFSHVAMLESLHITSFYDRHVLDRSIQNINTSQQSVLWPLTNLTQLNINIDWELAIALPRLFEMNHKLEILDLSNTRKLNYTNLKNTLVGLKNSDTFRILNLHNSQTLQYLANGLILNLTDLLDPLKDCPLEELDISYNALRTIIPGLITKAPRLKKVDVSNNMIVPLVIGTFFIEVVLHPSIVTADFSQQGVGERVDVSINHSGMRSWRPTRALKTTTNGVIPPPADVTSSPVYSANTNCLDQIMDDLCHIFTPDCAAFLHLCRKDHETFCVALTQLFEYISAIPCEYIPRVDAFLNKDCGGCYVFPMLGNLRFLYLHSLNNYDKELIVEFPVFENRTCYNPNNSIEMIDFANNGGHGYPDIDVTFSTPITGFNKMKVFNISNNGIQHPSPDLGDNLPLIEVLDMSHNLLDLVGKAGEFLTGAESVKELNLAGNVIAEIHHERFSTLSHLQSLNLSSNNLNGFDVNIGNLSHLAVLDLSDNMIQSLPFSMTRQLSNHAAMLKRATLQIHLAKNPLLCTCSVQAFTDWVLSNPYNIEFVRFNEYTCLNSDSNQVPFHNLHKSTVFECLSTNVYIGIGVGSGILVSAVITGLGIVIYRRRWWIRYHYFIARKMFRRHRQQDQANRDYQWDAFVSYNHHDRDWVEEILQPILEDQNGVRLCLHERDFQFGGYIPELIIGSIENSRKTLLILTPHFVQSNWCDFEMRMAQQRLFTEGYDVLLLAILKPLDNVTMSNTLKALLQQRNYLEWSDDAYGQKLFFARLIAALDIPNKPRTSIADELQAESDRETRDDALLIV